MVVSKDSKRKRKESPPPQPTAVESSPEMPKRTKVQAQRKFAQGQNAPTSSYSSVIAASSSSNTGPSTSSESREPPTEILPNKRPKTEDFLTFLCFRGTPALPAHLDFLNQGKTNEAEGKVKKPASKPGKGGKKGKKGRPKGSISKKEEPKPSTSKHATSTAVAASEITETKADEPVSAVSTKQESKPDIADNNVKSFAVRKRAEVVPGGNRRSRPPADRQPVNSSEADKCNNSPDTKRRSNRGVAKDTQQITEHENEECDEFYSAKDDASKVEEQEKESFLVRKGDGKKSKTPTIQERKSETPSKESETCRSRKGRPPSATKKGKDVTTEDVPEELKEMNSKESTKTTQKPDEKPKAKEKISIKRPRQKESPIFIPSPEPSGRMTRQRAFFEPVKVIHTEDAEAEKAVEDDPKTENADIPKMQLANKNTKKGKKKEGEDLNAQNKDRLNVFDFSSDDEQPLAKSMKLKKGAKGTPKKVGRVGKLARKITPQKLTTELKAEQQISASGEIDAVKGEVEAISISNGNEKEVPEDKQQVIIKSKGRGRGRTAKKKMDEGVEIEPEVEKGVAPTSPKKQSPARQLINKKSKSDISAVNGEEENETTTGAQARFQRPSRKTKEAAAIYMGIIGHKLQLAEDEDDDLSLNSFPDRPNVKEMEKMENELKKNAATGVGTSAGNSAPVLKGDSPKPVSTELTVPVEKPMTARRGRPPKQNKQAPVKREIEGMLVKKGAIAKVSTTAVESAPSNKQKSDLSKADSDDEDFLLNKEVNETKRKLEKNFSDSDDEPLAIKANIKSNDKDSDHSDSRKCDSTSQNILPPNQLMMLPITSKPISTPPLNSSTPVASASPVNAVTPQSTTPQIPSPFKTIEKKSPVPTSKILNVPATYAIPSATPPSPNVNLTMNSSFNKTPSYMPPASPHYHAPHVRPAAHPFPTAKSPTAPTPIGSTTLPPHLQVPLPPQSPLKYPAAPTTYPPPIEAYPSPKINPTFLTPKFDRTTLPRTNNFPSPSPVKFELSSVTKGGLGGSSLSSKMAIPGTGASVAITATTSVTTSATAGQAATSADPLKDEIGSILTASLMPSKEESGKVFGIASVSLAQSSGPDNTKCTLGKCGSIHKPVLGPVVPTEGYIGDQLSSKERRKAKVNMTHEQIQKWLIECSSNPDEIQDDLDDDYDDNLRPNLFATTPPPTRDDKESTSFSSSSKATRDLGKSESAWSAKGPSLKATPVIATGNRKDDGKIMDTVNPLDMPSDNDRTSGQAINLTQKKNVKTNSNANIISETATPAKATRSEKTDKKNTAVKKFKEEKNISETTGKDNKQNKVEKEKDAPTTSSAVHKITAVGKLAQPELPASTPPLSTDVPPTPKQNRKKNTTTTTVIPAADEKNVTLVKPALNTLSISSSATTKTPKRTPVYNQKNQPKQIELKETTTTSHKKSAPFSYGAFSADNEKSIYSFDKDDDEAEGTKIHSTPAFRRQSGRDSQNEESVPNTPTSKASPGKKRAVAASSNEKVNKETAAKSQNSSVSLTLSPSENCKLVKVSLDSEKPGVSSKTSSAKSTKGVKKQEIVNNDVDSDSEGHTFYIPLQGVGTGGDGEGGIQGVAVKLGREGPDGPNQKVIMHATLVTKAQMGSNSKPLPESMNVSDIMKTLIPTSQTLLSSTTSGTNISGEEISKKGEKSNTAIPAVASTGTSNVDKSSSNSLKNVPIGTVQPRFKGGADATNQPSTSAAAASASAGSGLVRVNSNSSLFSGSAKSRMGGAGPGPSAHGANKKFKDDTPIKMSNNTAFPRHDDPTQMVEAPIFRPTEKEFADPIDFIERITPIAARFGICKIIPPPTFKPECRISDEMRFTAYNQYVHKMLHRWGPSAKELSAIKKYLATQSIVMNHPPWIGGMEVDLPRLYHTVQELGGLKEVIEKKKWARVAEEMCIPKLAQDRVTKLDDIYCKYLLPYDTLSPAERQKLFDEVEADWAKREARARRNADRFVNTESVSNEEDDVSSEDDEESEEEVDGVSMECIVKGRSMPLSQFYRIARNTMALWFKNTEPIVNEVEAEFWRHVAVRDSHVCVHSGSIDSSGWGYGFPSPGPKGKGSNYARHPWNLKVLTNNPGSVLRSLGPVMGVTVPTLHVGMLFSACCWYRDPHGLSWIEYLHTGASKLWYGIPDDQSANFRSALTSLIPTHCQNKTIWLPCDTVMVPPHMLTDRGVSLCRIEQKPGEFIVVFPRAYTSSLATGYVVSESVYFATTSWLDLAKEDFRDIHDSCEPAMFSLEQLLFALGYDQRVTSDTLQQMLPMLQEVYEKELAAREQLKAAGVTSTEKVANEKGTKAKKQQPPHKSIENECDLCRANLYISMIKTEEGNVYCLQHALKNLNNGNIQAKQCKLIYAYNVEDIESLIKNLKDKIQQKRHAVTGKKSK
ncbi:serine-rich adhesin for platelets isoform X1 [Anastrepha ludens]|uniref:serine-rich adhesin for platelets isoform X1 n=1 Tax=Anastrepha ludens TaxID=28586 RepID=UPI0023B069A6|nr:serine-rich adhesin for platelets isoform X1 [Anastrepha ludens]